MKSTFRTLFYLKRDKRGADVTYPIMCRITIGREPSRFNIKVNVNPDIWDEKAGIATGKSADDTVEVNALLNMIKSGIYNVYHDLQTKENDVNVESFSEHCGKTLNGT